MILNLILSSSPRLPSSTIFVGRKEKMEKKESHYKYEYRITANRIFKFTSISWL